MQGTTGEARKNSEATFSFGHTSVCRLAKTNIHQLCEDTGYRLEDSLGAMADWEDGELECQGNLSYQHNLMMMRIYNIFL